MNLTFFYFKNQANLRKTLTVSESTFKIVVMSPQALFEILLTTVVICKQRFLHENEIVQYLQNYKFQDVNQGHLRKPSQAFKKP